MQIDSRDEQAKNADSPTRESLEPVPKDKRERFLQALKQNSEILSTDEGMQSD
jgi:hypothetical protein